MSFSQTLDQVVTLATAIRDFWHAELPKRHARYPFVSPDEDSGPPPREAAELDQLLHSLPAEEIYKLLLITQMGIGAVSSHDLYQGYERLRDRYPTPTQAAMIISGNAALADYLTDGIEELKSAGIDIDSLDFSMTASSPGTVI